MQVRGDCGMWIYRTEAEAVDNIGDAEADVIPGQYTRER
jgi:hypothetical protein